MSVVDSRRIVGMLAASDRRRVVAALILAGGEPVALALEDLAERAGLSLREAADAVDRLVSGGLVTSCDGGYLLDDDAFAHAARSEADRPIDPTQVYADHPDEQARILAAAIVDGRLAQLPSKRSKRLVVLDYMAQRFDIGVRYRENQVNETLSAFDTDVATLRRYLVDEQFLDRSNGEYWRCGGTV